MLVIIFSHINLIKFDMNFFEHMYQNVLILIEKYNYKYIDITLFLKIDFFI